MMMSIACRTWCFKYSAFTEKLPTRAFLVALEEDEEIEAQLSRGVNVRRMHSCPCCMSCQIRVLLVHQSELMCTNLNGVSSLVLCLPSGEMLAAEHPPCADQLHHHCCCVGVHQVQGDQRAAAQRQGGGVLRGQRRPARCGSGRLRQGGGSQRR